MVNLQILLLVFIKLELLLPSTTTVNWEKITAILGYVLEGEWEFVAILGGQSHPNLQALVYILSSGESFGGLLILRGIFFFYWNWLYGCS